MSVRTWVERWPVSPPAHRAGPARGWAASRSAATEALQPRVGHRGSRGEVDLPLLRGRLRAERLRAGTRRSSRSRATPTRRSAGAGCAPRVGVTLQLTTGPAPAAPGAVPAARTRTDWEELDLDTAMDMVADRVIVRTRRRRPGSGSTTASASAARSASPASAAPRWTTRRTTSSRSCSPRSGCVQIENQARICHSSTVAGLGTSFGRGGATTFMQDLQNTDCIVIEGSNIAECHPVGFQWVMEAKARGATVIHVDPRFTRTSAVADLHVPIRAGTDIAFLGGIINHVLANEPGLPRLRRHLHQRPDHPRRGLPRHRGPRRAVLRLRRGQPPLRHEHLAVTPAPASGVDTRSTRVDRTSDGRPRRVHGSGRTPMEAATRPDETLQHPRCVFQVLKRHYARYTPEMVPGGLRRPARRCSPRCAEALIAQLRPGPDHRVRLRGGLDPAHRRRRSTSAPRRVLQLLLGNIGRPGGGIHGPARARLHPGLHRHPHAVQPAARLPADAPRHTDQSLDDFLAPTPPTRASGATCRPTR